MEQVEDLLLMVGVVPAETKEQVVPVGLALKVLELSVRMVQMVVVLTAQLVPKVRKVLAVMPGQPEPREPTVVVLSGQTAQEQEVSFRKAPMAQGVTALPLEVMVTAGSRLEEALEGDLLWEEEGRVARVREVLLVQVDQVEVGILEAEDKKGVASVLQEIVGAKVMVDFQVMVDFREMVDLVASLRLALMESAPWVPEAQWVQKGQGWSNLLVPKDLVLSVPEAREARAMFLAEEELQGVLVQEGQARVEIRVQEAKETFLAKGEADSRKVR